MKIIRALKIGFITLTTILVGALAAPSTSAAEPLQVLTSPAALGASKPVIVAGKSFWLDDSQCYMRNEKPLPFLCFPKSIKATAAELAELMRFVSKADELLTQWTGLNRNEFQIYFGAVIFTDQVKETEAVVDLKYDPAAKRDDRATFVRQPIAGFSLDKMRAQLQKNYPTVLAQVLSPKLEELKQLQAKVETPMVCVGNEPRPARGVIRKLRDDQCTGYAEEQRLVEIDIKNLEDEIEQISRRRNFYLDSSLHENNAVAEAHNAMGKAEYARQLAISEARFGSNNNRFNSDAYVQRMYDEAYSNFTKCRDVAEEDPKYVEIQERHYAATNRCFKLRESDPGMEGNCWEAIRETSDAFFKMREKYFASCDVQNQKIYSKVDQYVAGMLQNLKPFIEMDRQIRDFEIAKKAAEERHAYYEAMFTILSQQRTQAEARKNELNDKVLAANLFYAACLKDRDSLEAEVPISVARHPEARFQDETSE